MTELMTRPQARVTWRDDGPVAVVAAVAAVVVWVMARVLGVDVAVRSGSGPQPVGVVSVAITALVVAAAGAGLLRLLERRTTRGLRTWTVVACVVWLVSFVGPTAGATPAAGLALAALHLVVGGVVVLGLRRSRSGRVA